MKISSVAIAILMAGAATVQSVPADETTFCNVYITTLPYTITTQGHYCFDRNLSTAITTGNAITIESDFVWLDMNHFKLGGGSAGPATSAVGVYANNHTNLTVRNGNIRGFAVGIQLGGTYNTSAQRIVVEDNALDSNTVGGIFVFAHGYLIRNNFLTNTGGGTSTTVISCLQGPQAIVSGISTLGSICQIGGSGEIVGNTVINTVPMAGTGGGDGAVPIFAIGALVMENRIVTRLDTRWPAVRGAVCRDNTTLGVIGFVYDCQQLVGANSQS